MRRLSPVIAPSHVRQAIAAASKKGSVDEQQSLSDSRRHGLTVARQDPPARLGGSAARDLWSSTEWLTFGQMLHRRKASVSQFLARGQGHRGQPCPTGRERCSPLQAAPQAPTATTKPATPAPVAKNGTRLTAGMPRLFSHRLRIAAVAGNSGGLTTALGTARCSYRRSSAQIQPPSRGASRPTGPPVQSTASLLPSCAILR